LSASYFPDKSDTEIIKELRVENGRIYADGEPMPLFNQADPGFKGNKWMTAPKNGIISGKP
jgi:hypothetical protein